MHKRKRRLRRGVATGVARRRTTVGSPGELSRGRGINPRRPNTRDLQEARATVDTFDYVIVGAGSAGSVLANRLSEDGTASVLVLEAGPSDWHPYIHMPAGFIKTFHIPSVNWLYQHGAQPMDRRAAHPGPARQDAGRLQLDQRPCLQPRPAHGLRHLGAARQPRLGLCRRAPLFPAHGAAPGRRRSDLSRPRRPLTVSDLEWRHPLCEAFIEGAVSLGIPRNPDYNAAIQEGVAYAQRTIDNGRRVSAATAFLHPARKRPNVTVRTHAHATELMFEGKRCVGVAYSYGGRGGESVQRASCARGDPRRPAAITRRSSSSSPASGRPALLKSLGIPVRHALAGVGENLRDHYAPRFTVRVKNIDTINERARGLKLVGEVIRYVTTRKGILSLNPTLVYCFWRSEPERRQLGPAAHLHAGELPGGRAGPARPRARHDHRLLAAAARQPRLRAPALGRSVRAADHPAQLSGGGGRPPRAARRHEARPPPAQDQAARALLRLRGLPGRQGAERRGADGRRQGARHHHLPPRRHLPHGAERPIRSPWSTTSCACTASRACA